MAEHSREVGGQAVGKGSEGRRMREMNCIPFDDETDLFWFRGTSREA